MTSSAQRKGDAAERELIGLLRDLTEWPIQRAYGAGRPADVGDVLGLPDCVAQVKSYVDPQRALRDALAVLETQRVNAGATYAVAFVRRPGIIAHSRWLAAMTVPQFVALLSDASNGPFPVARNPTR